MQYPKEDQTALQWYISGLGRVVGQVPIRSFLLLVLSLVARVSMLLAMLLPIKVILLLGAERTPRWFPTMLREMHPDQLIIVMMGGSLSLFIVHMICIKIMDKLLDSSTNHLASQSDERLLLFQDQWSEVRNNMSGYIAFLAGWAFTGLTFVLLYYLYIDLIPFFLVYLGIFYLGVKSLSRLQVIDEAPLKSASSRQTILSGLINVGFVAIFVFIVCDYLYFQPPESLIFAIIGFVMLRSALTNIAGSLTSMVTQHQKKAKVDALMFGARVSHARGNQDASIWELSDAEHRDDWVRDVVAQLINETPVEVSSTWVQSGSANFLNLNVLARLPQGDKRHYFFKVYTHRLAHVAANDVDLMTYCGDLPLFPELVKTIELPGKQVCHVLEVGDFEPVLQTEVGLAKTETQSLLAGYAVDPVLVNKYTDAHSLLYQRVNTSMLDRFRSVINASELDWLNEAEQVLVDAVLTVRQLPLTLIFTKIGKDAFLRDKQGNLKLVGWGNWKLEPLGVGWKSQKLDVEAFSRIAAIRSDIASHGNDYSHMLTASLLAEFEGAYSRLDMNTAVDKIKALQSLQRVQSEATSPDPVFEAIKVAVHS